MSTHVRRRVVGGRQQHHLDAERLRQPAGHRRQRLAATQCLGAHEMDAQVAIAELEPRLAAEA